MRQITNEFAKAVGFSTTVNVKLGNDGDEDESTIIEFTEIKQIFWTQHVSNFPICKIFNKTWYETLRLGNYKFIITSGTPLNA